MDCKRCKGSGRLAVLLMNMGTLEYTEAIIPCPSCDNGKVRPGKDDPTPQFKRERPA